MTEYPSLYARLDSNVVTGGGTDDTAVIQAILDTAQDRPLHLIMDGAALVGGLRIHSNTTIECPNASCGFFLRNNENKALLSAADNDYREIRTENVSLLGGTYNLNCPHQEHHTQPEGHSFDINDAEDWEYCTCGFRFCGIRNLLVRDVTTIDQRFWTMLVANFENVTMENIDIRLPNIMDGQNQDGLHFWGPGKCLALRNIKGTAGDDIIAIAPDERDLESDITDVLIDGLVLKDSDQGIRLLSRCKGRLDRVIIKNVTGTYKSFGFFINPWLCDDQVKGNIGSLTFENIDLRQENHKYHYSVPLLFRLGGSIERLVLKNIRHISADDPHAFLQLGGPYAAEAMTDPRQTAEIGTVVIDGLDLTGSPAGPRAKGIEVKCPVENLLVSRAVLNNLGDTPFIRVFEGGTVKNLMLHQIIANGTPLTGGVGIGSRFESDISI